MLYKHSTQSAVLYKHSAQSAVLYKHSTQSAVFSYKHSTQSLFPAVLLRKQNQARVLQTASVWRLKILLLLRNVFLYEKKIASAVLYYINSLFYVVLVCNIECVVLRTMRIC